MIVKVERESIEIINEETKIEPNFVCSKKYRAFFKEHIGKNFSFNVTFQKWLKTNTSKTYKEVITAYYQILEHRKKVKPPLISNLSIIHIFVTFLLITKENL